MLVNALRMAENRGVPLRTRVDRRVLVFEATGEYSLAEMDSVFAAALADPAARDLIGVLLDLRLSLSMSRRSTTDLHDVAAFYASMKDRIGGKVAVLTASDAAFGLGRMASVTAEHLGLAVLVTRDLAQAWTFLIPSRDESVGH